MTRLTPGEGDAWDEWLKVEVIKDWRRVDWDEDLHFNRLEVADPTPLPVGPVVVVDAAMGFTLG